MNIIVFFDGYCGLCSGTVDFLIVRDREAKIHYSPLQGETAKRLLSEAECNDLNTVIVVIERGQGFEKLRKSDAILYCLRQLPRWKHFAALAILLPRGIRDLCYDFIARNRFTLFKKLETCRAPSPEERKLFLP